MTLPVLAFAVPACGQQTADDRAAQAQAAGQALRGALRTYEGLVGELDLRDVPSTIHGYSGVMDKLDQLGEELENLSRHVVQAEQLDPAQFAQLQADIGHLATELTSLRRQAFPLRVWAYLHNHGYRKPGWGLGTAGPLTLSPPLPQDCGGEVGTTLDLWAARGEAESSQLLVLSFGRDLPAVTVSGRALRGRGSSIPAARVQCQPVAYVQEATEGSLPWPEILLPPGPVDVPGDGLQTLWVTVTVPDSQSPGLYQSELSVKPGGMGAIRVTLRVHVWDLDLPSPRSLAGSVPLAASQEASVRAAQTALLAGFGLTAEIAPSDSLPGVVAALAVGQSPTAVRLLGWQAWARGESGLDLGGYETTTPLVQPGPEGQPVASLQLAALRDALDDHELLLLAEARGEDVPRLAELLNEARRFAAAPQLETDAAARLLQLRQELGDALSTPTGTD